MKSAVFQFFILLVGFQLASQPDTVFLDNPSFEDTPRRGILEWGYYSAPPSGWYDCGRVEFPRETPPDIHPVDFWDVERPPYEGSTYLGMVVRDVDTWESVSQRLSTPLVAGNCYHFSIALSRSNVYISLSQELQREDNYTVPAVLRIWGGDGHCGRKELLGESDPVTNYDWKVYEFSFTPKRSHRYFILEAFYKTPTLFAYNGHILVDAGSHIIQKACPGEEEFIVAEDPEPEDIVEANPRRTAEPSSQREPVPPVMKEVEPITKDKKEPIKSTLSEQLDLKKLRTGQTIRIENLYFEADSSLITEESFSVLDEIFEFLKKNKNIVVEIGGHTNGNFGITHQYCDTLSNNRARTVAEYIMRKGISPKRIQYKGYGKRMPIATNRTKDGREKNQRVEIKILSLGE